MRFPFKELPKYIEANPMPDGPSELDFNRYKQLAERFGKSDNNFNEFVKDKRVIIVGPSPSLENTNSKEFIDSFDLVVRLNQEYPIDPSITKDIGTRTDIHYHNLHEAAHTGGPIHYSEMIKDNVYLCGAYPKYVMPFHEDVNRVEILMEIKYHNKLKFHIIDTEFYQGITKALKTRPNTGTNAILDLLAYDVKELYTTGITWFKDGWRKSYKDHIAMYGTSEGLEFENSQLDGEFDGMHIQQPQMDIIRDLYLNDKRFDIDNIMKQILQVK